jgi:YHS domain-containing protein
MNQAATKTDTVIDPVCGMSVNPAEGCRKSFIKTPEKYLEPKPEKKKGWWCRYTERLEKATGGKAPRCH